MPNQNENENQSQRGNGQFNFQAFILERTQDDKKEEMEAFLADPSRPTRFFSRDPVGNEVIAEGLYLTGYTRGYYGQTNGLPRRMADYAEENGLTFTGPVYNTYLFDELSVKDPERYLLQVSASVTEARRDPVNHFRRKLK
jgi:effector-binding domain-containing protein